MLTSWVEVNRSVRDGWGVVTKSPVPVSALGELVPWVTDEMKD